MKKTLCTIVLFILFASGLISISGVEGLCTTASSESRDFVSSVDDALPVVGGKVKAEDDWIVGSTGGIDRKYFKLGTTVSMDGYTLSVEHYSDDENIPTFLYTPEKESLIDNVTIMAAWGQAQEMAEKAAANIGAYLGNAVVSEAFQQEIVDRTGWSYSYVYEDAQVGDSAVMAVRTVNIYFDGINDISVLCSITAKANDVAKLPTVEKIFRELEPFVQRMTIDGGA